MRKRGETKAKNNKSKTNSVAFPKLDRSRCQNQLGFTFSVVTHNYILIPSPATHVAKLDKAIAIWILERYKQLGKLCVNAVKKKKISLRF